MALLHELMQADTAGDPQSDQKWSRKDTRSISQEMTARGVPLCPNTAAKLLKHQKYSLRVNRKSMGETQHPDRNRQFELIAYFRKRFEDAGSPILSLDTKKKELIGNFRNAGRAWRKDPELVNQHDFRSQASALVSPYRTITVGNIPSNPLTLSGYLGCSQHLSSGATSKVLVST